VKLLVQFLCLEQQALRRSGNSEGGLYHLLHRHQTYIHAYFRLYNITPGQLYRPNCRTKSKSWPPHLASSSISKEAQTNMFLSYILYHLGDHPAPQIPCPKQSKPIAIAHLQHSKFAASVHFGQPKQGVPRGCRNEPNLKELLAIWFWLGTETVGTLETY
jgi:hypothetical protein